MIEIGSGASERFPRHRIAMWTAVLLATTALTSPLLISPAVAQDLPSGGSVAAGSAVISQPSATQLTIMQSSQSAVVNWQSFSVGQGNAVNIAQPNASSAILNRVTGNASSNIAGSITANGSVYLVNPNGIAITSTGTVNTAGGFVASTLGISDSDFMSGKRTFTGNGASANVSNEGVITVGRGGYAALIGGAVSNAGSIDVPLGKVGLGAGEQATLDFSGDGFLQVAVPTSAADTGALINHSGSIKADGGSVIISAATAREAARNAINLSGTVQASSIGGRNGSITIGGGEGGKVAIGGELNVASPAQKGGSVIVTGRDIALSGAKLDASGATGGGTINIGGNWQGQGPLQRAQSVAIDADTTIKADAAQSGNGGNVVVWSDDLTTFAGNISARGGTLSGNGGDAEVSGKAKLAYTGFTDLSATNGAFGDLLLDPYNVTISWGAGGAVTGGDFSAGADDSILGADTLRAALGASNVIVSTGGVGSPGAQAGDIAINASLYWSTSATLTLQAAGSITLNNTFITAPTGGLTLNAGGAIDSVSDGEVNVARFTLDSGNWVQNASDLQTFAAGDFRLNGGTFLRATSGDGTTASPYMLSDIYGLQGIGTLPTQNYQLAADIDASQTAVWSGGAGFAPIGNNATPFTGGFDGAGHTISNLVINRPNSNLVGLFGFINLSGTVRNVGLLGGMVSGSIGVGGLAGVNYGSIMQAYATGAVSGTNYAGGLVGNNTGSVTQVYATGTVASGFTAGGLAGANTGSVTQAYATGAVSGSTIGGLVGYNAGSVTQAYATGALSGFSNVGGLVGTSYAGSNVTQSYWDTVTTGTNQGTGSSNGGIFDATGLTTTQFSTASNFTGWSFGTSPASSGWVIVDADGGLNNNSGAAGATRPFLLSEYSTAITNTHQLQLMALAPSALDYTLKADLDVSSELSSSASGMWYISANAPVDGYGFVPIGDIATGFTGWFDGVGHTISNLVINRPDSNQVGLFSSSNGMISNVGLLGGTVSGHDYVGGLAGINSGSITQVYATGAVSGSNYVGGLVGGNSGAITQVYATGAVSGSDYVGGLVGTNSGSVTQAYAAGPVSGVTAGGLVGGNFGVIGKAYAIGVVSGITAGGLVGTNGGYIGQAYATGNVSGTYAGGLVGSDGVGSNVTQSYWDTVTTGTSQGLGLSNGGIFDAAGLTTAQFSTVSNFAGWSFGTSAANSDWVIIDANGGLNNSGAVGATRPFLLSEYSTTITNTHQLQLMALAPSGYNFDLEFTLKADLDVSSELSSSASGMWYISANAPVDGYGFVPIGETISVHTGGFTAGFDGAGHIISNLVINRPGSDNVGLFGFVNLSGKIGNVSLLGAVVSGHDFVGGLVGLNSGLSISNVGVLGGAVSGHDFVGGLAGGASGMITQVYATSTVSGITAGGLVGVNASFIQQAYATGNVSGTYAGGLVGLNGSDGSIEQAYATGAVSGDDTIGGLAGGNYGSISQAYATGTLSGTASAGGLVGYNAGSITQSYATGAFSNSSSSGGLVGYTDAGSDVTQSFWDITTTGANQGVGDASVYPFSAIGLTTAQMQDLTTFQTTYAGWDFTNVWSPPNQVGQNNGSSAAYYPQLYTLSNVTTVDPTGTRQYGAANNTAPISYYGVQAGDQVTTSATTTGGPAATDAVGASAIVAASGAVTSSTVGHVYRYVYLPGTITVIPASLTITANDVSKSYGQTVMFGGTEFTASGLQNGESVGLVTLASLGAAAAANVAGSPYAIVASGLGGGSFDPTNYTIRYVDGHLTVTPAELTITANAGTKVYGDTDPTLSFAASGFQFSDNAGSVLTGALARATGENVNNYAIRQGSLAVTNANYTIAHYNGASFSITPAELTITVNAGTKIYGDTDPTLSFMASGFKFSDNAGSVLTGALARATGENVNNYAIGQGNLASNANYTIAAYNGASLGITPAELTITANAGSKTYGDTDPTLSFMASGFQFSDNAGSVLTGALARATGENVNNYAIGQGNLASNANYTIAAYNGASFSITPAALTVTADAQSRPEGAENPHLTYQIDGTLFYNDVVTGTLATSAMTSSAPGDYRINQGSLLVSPNYDLTYRDALLTVLPQERTTPPSAANFGVRAVFDDVNRISLPTNARPVFGAPTVMTSLGLGVFYADPRFDKVFVCFGGACFAVTP